MPLKSLNIYKVYLLKGCFIFYLKYTVEGLKRWPPSQV